MACLILSLVYNGPRQGMVIMVGHMYHLQDGTDTIIGARLLGAGLLINQGYGQLRVNLARVVVAGELLVLEQKRVAVGRIMVGLEVIR